jgi:hypothetical protein
MGLMGPEYHAVFVETKMSEDDFSIKALLKYGK